jgi:hypothetical protein
MTGTVMPPRRTALNPTVKVCQGAGMVAGLEIWRTDAGKFVLADHTADGRFADDIKTWNSSVAASLNVPSRKKAKDAAKPQ